MGGSSGAPQEGSEKSHALSVLFINLLLVIVILLCIKLNEC